MATLPSPMPDASPALRGAMSAADKTKLNACAPYNVSGLALDDPDHGFPYSPKDRETVIYLRAGGLASDTEPLITRPLEYSMRGDDVTGDGTKAKPLFSPDGVLRRFGSRAIEGERFLVRMAGGLTDAEVTAGVDPWDGQCSSMRQYAVRGLNVGGWEAYVNSFCWEGPAKAVLHTVQPVIGNLQHDPAVNGRTRWRLYNAASYGLGDLKGYYLRVMRGGLLVTNEIQITDNDATYLYTDHGNYEADVIYRLDDTFEIVYRAAEFIPTSRPGGVDLGEGGADGIAMQGFGTANLHGRLVNGQNPRFTFKWVGFENLNMRNVHGVSFDRCAFYHSFNAFNSSFTLRGCAVDSQKPTVFINCQVNVDGPTLYTEVQEFNGHALSASAPTNPIYPDIGGQGLYCYSGGPAAGGLQIRGGRFEPRKGLSVEGGIIVSDRAEFIMNTPGQAHSVHIRECTGAGTAGLHVKNDALAVIDTRNISYVNVTNHLKVGIGAAIDLGTEGAGEAGTFREVAGWNGNFSRHLEVNGSGKPTGDHSAIRDGAVWNS